MVRDHRGRVLQADGERQLGRGFFSEFEGTDVSVTVSVMSVEPCPPWERNRPEMGDSEPTNRF